MMICPHCGWIGGSKTDCERCSATLVRARDENAVRPADEIPDAQAEWVTIARFGNAAEAGYFSHELAPLLNCEPRIEYHDDFDAIRGAWRTRYLLTVPQQFAEQGRIQLTAMLDGSWEPDQPRPDSNDPFSGVESAAAGRAPHGGNSRINWVPIMLTLAAGSAVFWAGKKAPFLRHPVEPGGAGQRDFFEILGDGAHPWVQHRENGGGVRELRVNAGDGMATILEDSDGDGRFERELEFTVPHTQR